MGKNVPMTPVEAIIISFSSNFTKIDIYFITAVIIYNDC